MSEDTPLQESDSLPLVDACKKLQQDLLQQFGLDVQVMARMSEDPNLKENSITSMGFVMFKPAQHLDVEEKAVYFGFDPCKHPFRG